ncbi:AcrR family transcriptional regulator [Pedobacter cryoconitis]|uniref:AcrR family transcriptional regulator n=1 Tax=Pedobacter cryoconitis TaxID=188932 RepID=A0A7W8YRV8_9SPHI|nr:TetR/AcrR family transcriptional regulator [Pedobacter cryoconitis]MBB5620696.1 AcrR family transcriptional regulator [Pedobacter cryoconitis]MBB5646227.1 AcrR family transcriptional regulator [Pedobacter cryoconitis]
MRTRDIEKENLVKKIAVETIAKGGFESFSMNKLAKACGISVATLYIYYKDKDDLLSQLAVEHGRMLAKSMLHNFDAEASFEDGLRQQWENRYRELINNPTLSKFNEQLRASVYQDQFLSTLMEDALVKFKRFNDNIISRGEVREMPFEVYWSVAFAPLYALIKFNNEGQSLGGKPFKMTDEMLWEAFDLVVKGLRK